MRISDGALLSCIEQFLEADPLAVHFDRQFTDERGPASSPMSQGITRSR